MNPVDPHNHTPYVRQPNAGLSPHLVGADDGIRTRDPRLGDVKLPRGQSTDTHSTRTFVYVS
jgi:hypothetical protein